VIQKIRNIHQSLLSRNIDSGNKPLISDYIIIDQALTPYFPFRAFMTDSSSFMPAKMNQAQDRFWWKARAWEISKNSGCLMSAAGQAPCCWHLPGATPGETFSAAIFRDRAGVGPR
jgi:hypothetical protein